MPQQVDRIILIDNIVLIPVRLALYRVQIRNQHMPQQVDRIILIDDHVSVHIAHCSAEGHIVQADPVAVLQLSPHTRAIRLAVEYLYFRAGLHAVGHIVVGAGAFADIDAVTALGIHFSDGTLHCLIHSGIHGIAGTSRHLFIPTGEPVEMSGAHGFFRRFRFFYGFAVGILRRTQDCAIVVFKYYGSFDDLHGKSCCFTLISDCYLNIT